MEEKEIINKLDELLLGEKTKSFFNHILRAYFPLDKVDKVFFKPKDTIRCVITSEVLIPLNDVVSDINDDELKDKLFDYIKHMFDFNFEPDQQIKDLIESKSIPLQGSDTTTYISLNTYRVMYDWVEDKKNKNDKHINWVFKNYGKKHPKKQNKKMENNKKDNNTNSAPKKDGTVKSATYSLGELGVLKELKKKMSK
jgi:hypothetical protein